MRELFSRNAEGVRKRFISRVSKTRARLSDNVALARRMWTLDSAWSFYVPSFYVPF